MELAFIFKNHNQGGDQSGHILGLCKGHEKINNLPS
jgi:hypothetical protein